MAREPKYDTQLYNDAAIAVGVWVEGAFYAPYDGYIGAMKAQGAGVEDCKMRTSAGDPEQQFPGTDLAIDTDTLVSSVADPGGYTLPNGFCVMNQPILRNTRVDITYPNGTGTAEANIYCIFTKTPIGNGKFMLWNAAEDTGKRAHVVHTITV